MHHDHHDVHVIHDDHHHHQGLHHLHHDEHHLSGSLSDNFELGGYSIGPGEMQGRMLAASVFDHDGKLGDITNVAEEEAEEASEAEYENLEKFQKSRSKKNVKKMFTNKMIGWQGRSDYDKIAAEYLASLKDNPVAGGSDDLLNDEHTEYEDENWHNKK